jgi:ABC-2 type transport system permease protein
VKRTLSLGLERSVLELKAFLRSREAVVFNLTFPVLLLVLFNSIFHGEIDGTGVQFRQAFTSGIIASGIMSTSFNSLAISLAFERHDGTLKRLAATPMPKAAYFIGKLVMAFVLGALSTAIMLAFGVLVFGLHLPSDAGRWLALGYVFVLGSLACSLMGIAYSRVPRDAQSAAAVVTPPYIALQFISGVFFIFSDESKSLQFVASLFPLRWMASALRYAFLPANFEQIEPGGSYHLGVGAAVMGAWLVAAFVICLRTFRFVDDD